MLYAVLAWLVAAVCVAVVYARARRLSAIELPTTEALVERALAEGGAEPSVEHQALRRIALDEIVGDIDRETRRGAEWARALARVSLASGTALSLLGMIERRSSADWIAIAATFLAGVVGSVGTAFVGRLADERSRRVREHWSGAVRRARVRLQTL